MHDAEIREGVRSYLGTCDLNPVVIGQVVVLRSQLGLEEAHAWAKLLQRVRRGVSRVSLRCFSGSIIERSVLPGARPRCRPPPPRPPIESQQAAAGVRTPTRSRDRYARPFTMRKHRAAPNVHGTGKLPPLRPRRAQVIDAPSARRLQSRANGKDDRMACGSDVTYSGHRLRR